MADAVGGAEILGRAVVALPAHEAAIGLRRRITRRYQAQPNSQDPAQHGATLARKSKGDCVRYAVPELRACFVDEKLPRKIERCIRVERGDAVPSIVIDVSLPSCERIAVGFAVIVATGWAIRSRSSNDRHYAGPEHEPGVP